MNDKDYIPSAIKYADRKDDSSKVYEELKEDYDKKGYNKGNHDRKIVVVAIIIFLGFLTPFILLGINIFNFVENTTSEVFDIVGSTTNDIINSGVIDDVKNQSQDIINNVIKQKDVDNHNFLIDDVGLINDLTVINILNEVIKINDSKVITIRYNDIEYVEDVDIIEKVTLKIESFNEYIVTNEKDKDGYINKIIIKSK